MTKRTVALLALVAAAACGSERVPAVNEIEASEPPSEATVQGWASAPSRGVQITRQNGTTLVSTGPHTVLWQRDVAPLQPPYTVQALLHKRSGRIHEGYGLVFGGDPLDAPEDEQAYSYFLIRGDGSFLIRRREGTALPILRAWTSDRAIRRDVDHGGQPNRLEVEVGLETTIFRVNGAEVAQLPTAELRVHGLPGLRIAHDVRLEISEFSVETGTAGAQ